MGQWCLEVIRKCRGSRRLVLLIVAIALLLDNMLLTSVVPIIPNYLYELHEAGGNTSVTEGPALLGPATETRWDLPGSTLVPPSPPTPTPRAPSTTMSPQELAARHDVLTDENVEVGVLFASKPVVQALVNPIVGPLTNKIGYTVPMFSGFIIMFISTLVFAVGSSYGTLFLARTLQGVGSACTSVAGMGMLAEKYPDDRERGNAMAIAMGGLALGVMIGPPFGGVMYEFVSKSAPFLVLAVVALLDGLLQLFVLQPRIQPESAPGAPLCTLLRDPYILAAAGAITFANMGIAVLEPSLPLWLMDTMRAPRWQQGAVFLPASIAYLIGTNVFGPLGHRMGRWLSSMTGLFTIAICLVCIPMARHVNHLIVPNAGIGFAIGMVDSSMMPMLGYLVDLRHTSVYGSVYSIGDTAFCVGFVLGPIVSSAVVKHLGFQALLYMTAAVCFLYSPLMLLLRNPPGRNENQSLLLQQSGLRYAPYVNEEDEDQ
ncbi:synaptic vesicular amine transporter-like [Ornithodoros turicata]|uniref:synaptic vesicular amine transporter-like n=1 Tax=Ornithodoros turicata TaxID=34597 RepID=UPI0031394FEF